MFPREMREKRTGGKDGRKKTHLSLSSSFSALSLSPKTTGLGSVLPYGILLLVVEVLGATTVLVYGINLLFSPLHEKPPVDEDYASTSLPAGVPPPSFEMPKVALPYHVRVLVPCYKEELEICQRTVLAAAAAPLPARCRRTVYLCDDGRDKAKRDWIRSLGDSTQFVYVSGRERKKGEMNGKSANLNNVCSQLYPKDVAVVPGNELVCVFDADQVRGVWRERERESEEEKKDEGEKEKNHLTETGCLKNLKTQKNSKKRLRRRSGCDLAVLREDAPAVRRRGRRGDGAEPAGEEGGGREEREREDNFFFFFLFVFRHQFFSST